MLRDCSLLLQTSAAFTAISNSDVPPTSKKLSSREDQWQRSPSFSAPHYRRQDSSIERSALRLGRTGSHPRTRRLRKRSKRRDRAFRSHVDGNSVHLTYRTKAACVAAESRSCRTSAQRLRRQSPLLARETTYASEPCSGNCIRHIAITHDLLHICMRVLSQRGFHLSELNAESIQLHLPVRAAQYRRVLRPRGVVPDRRSDTVWRHACHGCCIGAETARAVSFVTDANIHARRPAPLNADLADSSPLHSPDAAC